jgi:hypothetical protein
LEYFENSTVNNWKEGKKKTEIRHHFYICINLFVAGIQIWKQILQVLKPSLHSDFFLS